MNECEHKHICGDYVTEWGAFVCADCGLAGVEYSPVVTTQIESEKEVKLQQQLDAMEAALTEIVKRDDKTSGELRHIAKTALNNKESN